MFFQVFLQRRRSLESAALISPNVDVWLKMLTPHADQTASKASILEMTSIRLGGCMRKFKLCTFAGTCVKYLHHNLNDPMYSESN